MIKRFYKIFLERFYWFLFSWKTFIDFSFLQKSLLISLLLKTTLSNRITEIKKYVKKVCFKKVCFIINCSYIQYGIDNTTILEQLSRNAFMSLRSESYIEPPLLTPEEKKARWLQRKLKKQQKIDKRGSFIFQQSISS